MVAGPAALAVALILLPGWVYWRQAASPRTARSALGELFEVVAAGAVATGVTLLAYVSLPDRLGELKIGAHLINPADLSVEFVQSHATKVSWTVAAFVGIACALAALAAKAERWHRKRSSDDRSTYTPEVPIWVPALGNQDCVLSVELRDGRLVSGYLGGHSVDEDGTPTIFLTPPLVLETPRGPSALGARFLTKAANFGSHSLVIPGAEIICVWRKFDGD